MKIYTGVGDQGETSLLGGVKIPKNDPRVEAYGNVDELNSFIGMTIALGNLDDQTRSILHEIQNFLFVLGTQLASPSEVERPHGSGTLPHVTEEHVKWVEQLIDDLTEHLPDLRSFILPGGHPGAALLHVCRTVCRRTERSVVNLMIQSKARPDVVLKFLNRLSDLFFVLARHVNWKNGEEDIIWERKVTM